MIFPNLTEEKRLWKIGEYFVFGLDEAGRGPLAGPVVAAAVVLDSNIRCQKLESLGINDSKKLSPKKREKIYDFLTNSREISWGVGMVSEKIIDKINILEATKLAMKKAVVNLISNSSHYGKASRGKQISMTNKNEYYKNNIFLLIDGNFKINIDVPQKSIIKGDQKVLSIAMASVIAKVYRDSLMLKSHKKFPEYGFINHKGYGTKHHYKMIKKFGPSKIHRKTFNLSN